MAEIWAEVLGAESVGIEDSFLDLGGHSILAAQVQARLAEVFPLRGPAARPLRQEHGREASQHLRSLARAAGVDARRDLPEPCAPSRTHERRRGPRAPGLELLNSRP